MVLDLIGSSFDGRAAVAAVQPKFVAQSRPAAGLTAPDRIDLPPEQRQFSSPSGDFLVTVQAVDGWKTPRASAALGRSDGRVLWRRDLPHAHGPRRVLVADDGRVLLVDEWINVVSSHALALIAIDGRTIAEVSAEQIFDRLGVPRKDITAHARFGIWITDGPTLSADGKSVQFRTGGRRLTMRLEDGRLSVTD